MSTKDYTSMSVILIGGHTWAGCVGVITAQEESPNGRVVKVRLSVPLKDRSEQIETIARKGEFKIYDRE